MSLDYYGPKRRLRGACGFTLIEVLVSLGIVSVALLAGISAFLCEQAGRDYPGIMIVTATPNPSFRRVDALIKNGDSVLIKLSTVVGRY